MSNINVWSFKCQYYMIHPHLRFVKYPCPEFESEFPKTTYQTSMYIPKMLVIATIDKRS